MKVSREQLWYAFKPGVKKWVEWRNCTLDYNGVVPCITKDGNSVDISFEKMEQLANAGDYSGFQFYIKNLCDEVKGVKEVEI